MEKILEAEHLIKDFPLKKGTFRVLDDICLTVQKGDSFGIIGESGAGKSTLLKCLSSLEPISSGKLEFQRKPYHFKNKKLLRESRRKIGMIFQHFHLLNSRTVEQNISLPLEIEKTAPEEIKKRVDELLKLVGLEEKKDCHPLHLSGGEKQRVAIARALSNNPEILFCDEATSSLDPKTTSEILDLLKRLNKEFSLTLLLITHEMDVIRKVCNKVAVIDKGKIVEQGSTLEVFNAPKHQKTRSLLQNTSHELDLSSLRKIDSDLLFLKLHFKGDSAQKPILSHLISTLGIEVNILSGWIDSIDGVSLGSLTVALKGEHQKEALLFLKNHNVPFEAL